MRAWLSREATYVKVTLEPRLRAQISRGNTDILRILYRQVVDGLGGDPVSCRWEWEGENVVVGAAL